MKTKALFSLILTLLSLSFVPAHAELDIHGKIDAGVAIADIELISGGVRDKSQTLKGISSNGSIIFSNGFTLKPVLTYAENNGTYYNIGMGFAYYLPVKKNWSLMPSVGLSYNRLTTHRTDEVEQRLRSRVQFIAADVSYTGFKKLMITGGLQHAWNQSTATFNHSAFDTTAAEARGLNYTLMLDYYLSDNWTAQVAGTIKKSRAKETEGSDAKGIRFGFGYIF